VVSDRLQRHSTSWQKLHGIYWLALAANFKVKFHPVGTRGAHFGNCLPGLDLLPLPNQQPTVMAIGAYIGIAMLDDYQLAVAPQATPGVHHGSIRRSENRLSQISGDINSFIQTTV